MLVTQQPPQVDEVPQLGVGILMRLIELRPRIDSPILIPQLIFGITSYVIAFDL